MSVGKGCCPIEDAGSRRFVGGERELLVRESGLPSAMPKVAPALDVARTPARGVDGGEERGDAAKDGVDGG
jgi:hypothetical protein